MKVFFFFLSHFKGSRAYLNICFFQRGESIIMPENCRVSLYHEENESPKTANCGINDDFPGALCAPTNVRSLFVRLHALAAS